MNKNIMNLMWGCYILLVVLGWMLRQYDIEISIYPIILVAALYFTVFALINLSGNEILIASKYRGTEAAKAWQKGTIMPNVLISIGCLALGVLVWNDNKLEFPDFWMCYLLWLLFMAIMVIWLSIVTNRFYETMDKEDRPWLMR